MPENNISYEKDVNKAIQLVDKGNSFLAIILNPTRIEQVKEIASAGLKMPGKATYFYPKPLSGLVIHRLK